MKRLFSLMLSFFTICTFSMVAKGESVFVSGPYQIAVNDGYAKIIYCDVSNSEIAGAYTVPSEIGGYKVREIGDRAFEGASGITNLTIPEGIETVGEYAFYRCNYFKSLYLPDSLKNIGKGAFEKNLSLISVCFPKGITKIADNMFKECGFYEIVIPDSVSEIGASAFDYNRNLSKFIYPQTLKESVTGRFIGVV